MFKFWQKDRATMRARIAELEDALTSARANLATEKRLHNDTFNKLDAAITKLRELEVVHDHYGPMKERAEKAECRAKEMEAAFVTENRLAKQAVKDFNSYIRRENIELSALKSQVASHAAINDELRADRDQWRERVAISEGKAANRYRELQNKFDKLTETSTAFKKEAAEKIQNLISEKEDIRYRCEQDVKAYEAVEKEIETHKQGQTTGSELPLLTSIPKPPAEGRWKLVAENGEIDWYNDGHCSPRTKPIGPFMARCTVEDRRVDPTFGESYIRCYLQNGHGGPHRFDGSNCGETRTMPSETR